MRSWEHAPLEAFRTVESFYMAIDPEVGFTSDVIRDPSRFVGRRDLIQDCIRAVNTPLGLIAVYGNRGVGKSSLLRQIQQMALGDYTLAKRAGLGHTVPVSPRKYLTVYYTADQFISDGQDLLKRLCNDQNEEDGFLRLVPNDGKELTEFTRSKEVSGGADLKLVNWGAKGVEESKYARTVPDDVVQTFRNYLSAIVTHQVKRKMGRDGLLILIDEFDVIRDKSGIGSLIKSLSSSEVKFAVCGIGRDLYEIVEDHASVERLLEEGALHVRPMSQAETREIFTTAERLFKNQIDFSDDVVGEIVNLSEGYPYFAQLVGKECVTHVNSLNKNRVDMEVFNLVLDDVKRGTAFPTLESSYQRAIGSSEGRQILLHFLAEQNTEGELFNEEGGKVVLSSARRDARDLDIEYVDQLMPRLVEQKYGPILRKTGDRRGEYEFVNPVLRLYIRLRNMS